jgi:hypothetical protein
MVPGPIMNRASRALVLSLALSASSALTGCVAWVASSQKVLSPTESQVTVPGDLAVAERALTKAFAARGFQLADRSGVAPGPLVLTYKGSRSDLTTISGNSTGVSASTFNIGSIFKARLTLQGAQVVLDLYGKPTVDTYTSCDPNQPAWVGPCTPEKLSLYFAGIKYVEGTEEAEVIKGVRAALLAP